MNKIEMSLITWIAKRIMSKSPEFQKKIRRIAGIITAVLAMIKVGLSFNLVPVPPSVSDTLNQISTTLGIFFTAIFGSTWLGTTDPALMSPSSKQAVIDEAKAKGDA